MFGSILLGDVSAYRENLNFNRGSGFKCQVIEIIIHGKHLDTQYCRVEQAASD